MSDFTLVGKVVQRPTSAASRPDLRTSIEELELYIMSGDVIVTINADESKFQALLLLHYIDL